MEALRIGLVQWAPSDNPSDNRLALDAAFDQFEGVDVVVLPEYSSWYHPDTSLWNAGAESLDGEFVEFLRGAAARLDATVIAGMLVRESRGITNTVVAVDARGLQGRYDKVHLYDAFGAMESAVITAGDPAAAPLVVTVKGWKIGVQTCYDLRFPEVSRRLIDADADILAVPSDWVPGPNKSEHWRALLKARAIENISWVVAANHAAPSGTGESLIIDPLGRVIIEAGKADFVGDVTIDKASVSDARKNNPALEARRYSITPN
jgi:predicted amidohydrolase